MTEIEAKVINRISDLAGDYKCYDERLTHDEALVLDKVLNEIQQYRAIGLTPELIEAMQGHNIALINDLGEYQQIGTIEEFKALKEKSVAKKPILARSMMTKKEFQICPVCERLVLYDGIKFDYCQYCGQKLDWSE